MEREALAGTDVEVAFDAPTKDWAARRTAPTVDVYLYDIREDLRRRERGLVNSYDGDRITSRQLPPRYFKLSYLVTAWTQRPEDEHRLLAALLGCFLRHEALPEDLVTGPLADPGLPVPVTIALPPPEDRSFADVWSALGGELKPSLDIVVIAPTDTGREFVAAPLITEPMAVDLGGINGQWPPDETRRGRLAAHRTIRRTARGRASDAPSGGHSGGKPEANEARARPELARPGSDGRGTDPDSDRPAPREHRRGSARRSPARTRSDCYGGRRRRRRVGPRSRVGASVGQGRPDRGTDPVGGGAASGRRPGAGRSVPRAVRDGRGGRSAAVRRAPRPAARPDRPDRGDRTSGRPGDGRRCPAPAPAARRTVRAHPARRRPAPGRRHTRLGQPVRAALRLPQRRRHAAPCVHRIGADVGRPSGNVCRRP